MMAACCCFCRQTQLFDTFDESSSISKNKWNLVQGGRVGIGCASLVEGQTMMFEGHGRRLAVTVDLDLRYARLSALTSSASVLSF